jgi:hypothetical protein
LVLTCHNLPLLRVRDQVSQAYKLTGSKIMVFNVLIFMLLGRIQKERRLGDKQRNKEYGLLK